MPVKSKITLIVFVFIFMSCKRELPPQKIKSFYKVVITPDDRKMITPQEAKPIMLTQNISMNTARENLAIMNIIMM